MLLFHFSWLLVWQQLTACKCGGEARKLTLCHRNWFEVKVFWEPILRVMLVHISWKPMGGAMGFTSKGVFFTKSHWTFGPQKLLQKALCRPDLPSYGGKLKITSGLDLQSTHISTAKTGKCCQHLQNNLNLFQKVTFHLSCPDYEWICPS